MRTQPIASGHIVDQRFNQLIPWKSLTSNEEARSYLLTYDLKKYNDYRRPFGFPALSHADYVAIKHKCSVFEYLNKPLTNKERLRYYTLKSKYNNNYPILK